MGDAAFYSKRPLWLALTWNRAVQWGRAGSPPGSGDYADEICGVASQLLLERARREMKDPEVPNAA